VSASSNRAATLAGTALALALLTALAGGAVARGDTLQAPPPPGAPKLANLKPVAVQTFGGVSVIVPIILPRDAVYPGSGGQRDALGGISGRFMAELLRTLRDTRALACTGRLLGRPGGAQLALGYRLPKAVPRATQQRWERTLRQTKARLAATAQCSWGLQGRQRLARETIVGSFTWKYSGFWTGAPGSISRRFTVHGMCDRPGCPISRANPYVVLKVT
jgi:hypothetical protein